MDFASLMSAQIAKSAGPSSKTSSTPGKYQRQSELEEARAAAYREEQAALEKERLAKAEKKRRLAEEEAARNEERELKRKKLVEETKRRQQEESEQAERERRRRIGLPDLPTIEELEKPREKSTPLREIEQDLDDDELSRKLRDLHEPVKLFAESHSERLKRFYSLQRAQNQESNGAKAPSKPAYQPIKTSLQPVAYDDLEVGTKPPASSDYDGRLLLARRISTWLNMILEEWQRAMAGRDEVTKSSQKGKEALRSLEQALENLKPLFRKLEKMPSEPSTLPGDILKPMLDIVDKMQQRKYVRANDAYLQLSIGKAQWPIGVTMVGIHERSSREKINEGENKAHIMADEETRKILQSIKRCLTFAQTRWPPYDIGQLMG